MLDPRWKSELDAVLDSRRLARSPRLRQLLAWLVTQTAEGRLELLNEYDAARALKGIEDHDPALQSDIRKLLSRLRRVLHDYYRTEGAARRWRISLPGGFTPRLSAPDFPANPAGAELVVRFEPLQILNGASVEAARAFESELLYRLGGHRGLILQIGETSRDHGAVLAGRIWGRDPLLAVLQLIEVRSRILRAQARVEISPPGDVAAAAARAVDELCQALHRPSPQLPEPE